MLNRTREIYASWDIKTLGMAERSILYNLEPIGIGTPYVESLTSYISRLASKHCVTTGKLIEKTIGIYLERKYISKHARVSSFDSYDLNINNCRELAKDFVLSLNKLTTRIDLENLTLIPWRSFLRSRVLREKRVWCSQCLREWYERGVTIYEPLIWQLKEFDICPIHQTPLNKTCFTCTKQQSIISRTYKVGYCNSCIHPLWDNGYIKQELIEQTSWDKWKTENLMILVRELSHNNDKEILDVDVCLSQLINKYCNGDISVFAKTLNLDRKKLYNWVKGQQVPLLEQLLALSYYFKLPLYNLLTGKLSGIDDSSSFNYEATNYLKKKSKNKIDVNQLRKDVNEILHLNEFPPPPLREVVSRLNYSASSLHRHADEVCVKIVKKHQEYTVKEKNKKVNKTIDEIIRITIELHSKGIYPSNDRVCNKLTNSGYYLYREVWETHKKMLKDLGYNN